MLRFEATYSTKKGTYKSELIAEHKCLQHLVASQNWLENKREITKSMRALLLDIKTQPIKAGRHAGTLNSYRG